MVLDPNLFTRYVARIERQTIISQGLSLVGMDFTSNFYTHRPLYFIFRPHRQVHLKNHLFHSSINRWCLTNCFCMISRCSTTSSNSIWRYLPNYLVSYIPLLIVMIINPILYSLSSASIPNLISQYLSQYTNTERKIVDKIKIKYGFINLTFYVCWLPNIAAAILIFSSWDNFPEKVIITLWYIMVSFHFHYI